MVAPGFRSRIATGLLVAAVVLPVPIGATSAVAADRRATPIDRPPLLARPGDQPDDVPGADGFGLDGLDDFAIGPPPVDGPGAGGAGCVPDTGATRGLRRCRTATPACRTPFRASRTGRRITTTSGAPRARTVAPPPASPVRPRFPAVLHPGARRRQCRFPQARQASAPGRGGIVRRRPGTRTARSACSEEAPQACGIRIPRGSGHPVTARSFPPLRRRGPVQPAHLRGLAAPPDAHPGGGRLRTGEHG